MFKNIPLEKILSTAKSYGADFAELFAEETSTILLSHENKRIEKSIDGIDSGYGIRVVYNDKTSYGFTNDPNELTELARTIASAGHSGTANKTPNISISTPKIRETSRKKNGRDEKLSTAHKMIEEAARAAYLSPQISQVQITFRNLERRIWIANSDGLYACDDHPDTVMAVLAIAQNNGIVQTGFEPIGGSFDAEELLKDKKFDPVKLAKMSANRALMMLSAKMAPRGNMPVVISSSAGGTMIHEAVGHGLEADLAGQGMSVYKDKLGKNVASPLVTVIDDATLTKGRGSFTCDDEGHPSQKTVLIENGILKTYMHDRMTALRMGTGSTGNGRRESYRYRPIVRMTNTTIASGKDDPESIIRSVQKGLLIKKIGGGQVNTINGDFVFEAQEAYLIEGGKQGEPVRGATIIGNGPKALMDIDKVGTDIGYGLGTCGKEGQGVPVGHGMPTIRIPEITVGGTG